MSKVIDRSKSNLKIKQRTKRKTQRDIESKNRRKHQQQLLDNVNVIFGLDNGATGSIACIIRDLNYIDFLQTPIKTSIDYTKEIQKINRIDIVELKKWFEKHIKVGKQFYKNKIKIIVILQRPMVNPQRFKQSRFSIESI